MKKTTLFFLLIVVTISYSNLSFAQEKTKKLFNQELTIDNQRSIKKI